MSRVGLRAYERTFRTPEMTKQIIARHKEIGNASKVAREFEISRGAVLRALFPERYKYKKVTESK